MIMISRSVPLIALIMGVTLLVTVPASAQKKDKLTYVLTRVDKLPPGEDPEQNKIEVAFGESFPDKAVLEKASNWLVLSGEKGKEVEYRPVSAVVFTADPTQNLVILEMAEKLGPGGELDPSTHRITVLFQQANHPDVQFGQPEKKGAGKAFTASKGKSDADIYLSGTAAGAKGSKPLYSFEAKVGYLWNLGRAGSLGGKATAEAAKEPDLDPDSITAKGAYEKIIVFAPATGIILRSDFLGAEFDKNNKTCNLATGLEATLVIPSAGLGEHNFATMDFLVGVEGGHNYRHKLDPQGLGNYCRWKLGANAYFVALSPPVVNRITSAPSTKSGC